MGRRGEAGLKAFGGVYVRGGGESMKVERQIEIWMTSMKKGKGFAEG